MMSDDKQFKIQNFLWIMFKINFSKLLLFHTFFIVFQTKLFKSFQENFFSFKKIKECKKTLMILRQNQVVVNSS